MSGCAPAAATPLDAGRLALVEEIRLGSRALAAGLYQIELSVPGVHCAGCIRTVEAGLTKLPGVEHARVNLAAKRVAVRWRGDRPPDLLDALDTLGFPGHLAEAEGDRADPQQRRLISALAVAGFAAMNIMLLSVSVWSGADPDTRQAFHWISAALALACLVYSGRIFFVSAWGALRRGRTNMDVPISVGICLAFGLSLYDTVHHGPHAYFDAATSLVFFLLIGRTLDHVMREKARAAVRDLARLTPGGAMVLGDDGTRRYLPLGDVAPGMRVALAVGDRVPVDGVVRDGRSDLDCAIVTGESAWRAVQPGDMVQAGMLNVSAPLTIVASARADRSFLAEMVRMMEAAAEGRARYRRIADRAAALYSPIVHTLALLTFLGWMMAGGDWHRAVTIAIAVLIITCPCALGLAVPVVHVVAARRLFENGIMVKDGSAIERMAEIDTVVFDKTGTLTLGRPRVVRPEAVDPEALRVAAALAVHSSHPISRAIVALSPASDAEVSDVREEPGLGIHGRLDGRVLRLGRADWALARPDALDRQGTVLACDGMEWAHFAFEDGLRGDALAAVDALRAAGMHVAILSGDTPAAARAVAATLGVTDVAASLRPAQKVDRLVAMAAAGRRVLMVGDGLNDVPALAAAHASMAPAAASDVGRSAADFVFLGDGLDAVPTALRVAREAGRLVRQNLASAVAYNAVALPIAVAGYVTPLLAALAMSLSSIVVVANALRLGAARRRGRAGAMAADVRRREGVRWEPA